MKTFLESVGNVNYLYSVKCESLCMPGSPIANLVPKTELMLIL